MAERRLEVIEHRVAIKLRYILTAAATQPRTSSAPSNLNLFCISSVCICPYMWLTMCGCKSIIIIRVRKVWHTTIFVTLGF